MVKRCCIGARARMQILRAIVKNCGRSGTEVPRVHSGSRGGLERKRYGQRSTSNDHLFERHKPGERTYHTIERFADFEKLGRQQGEAFGVVRVREIF